MGAQRERAGSLILIDRTASTVEIAGRRFPAVGLICPPEDDRPQESERDRALAAGGGDQSVYVPAENGVLFRVEEGRNEHHHGLSLDINARTCRRYYSGGEWLWLPCDVAVIDGELLPGSWSNWYWAEPDWVVETIDRLSHKPFTQPDGPLCQLVRLDHFEQTCDAGSPS
jgi:hypothetical protein